VAASQFVALDKGLNDAPSKIFALTFLKRIILLSRWGSGANERHLFASHKIELQNIVAGLFRSHRRDEDYNAFIEGTKRITTRK
jgi:hypothetical protein